MGTAGTCRPGPPDWAEPRALFAERGGGPALIHCLMQAKKKAEARLSRSLQKAQHAARSHPAAGLSLYWAQIHHQAGRLPHTGLRGDGGGTDPGQRDRGPGLHGEEETEAGWRRCPGQSRGSGEARGQGALAKAQREAEGRGSRKKYRDDLGRGLGLPASWRPEAVGQGPLPAQTTSSELDTRIPSFRSPRQTQG